jgi:hypothetical protein
MAGDNYPTTRTLHWKRPIIHKSDGVQRTLANLPDPNLIRDSVVQLYPHVSPYIKKSIEGILILYSKYHYHSVDVKILVNCRTF